MATQASEFIAGVTYDDTANTVTIDTTSTLFAAFFGGLPALTSTNSEVYDAALLLGLENSCDGLDTNLDSPVGRGTLPFNGIEKNPIARTDGTNTEIQELKQIYLGVYLKSGTANPSDAVNNDD